MRHEFRLADIGEGLEEAEIVNWLVAVGDRVSRDQPLIEVMTDKSNAELPAPADGTVIELGGAVGDIIEVGELIAVIQSESAPTGQPAVAVASVSAAAVSPAAVSPAATLSPVVDKSPATSGRVKAAPSTRRAAAEQGIDLTTIVGSGPGGRILLADLTNAQPQAARPPSPGQATSPASASPPTALVIPPAASAMPDPAELASPVAGANTVPLRGVRRAVARNMAQSWSEIPHIHAFQHIDAEPMLEVRSRLRDTDRPSYAKLTPLAFFVAAVARALGEHPDANASINMDDETITRHSSINVGVAVAAEHGLVVPVLQAADQLDFETLSLTLTQLVRGAREGQLGREHYLGGTVTITNFGALGGEQAAPLIRPPEAMILGFGSIADRPFVIDEEVVARKTMHLVAGADHRLLDGDTTTAVLTTIARLLSDPLELVI